MPQLEPSSYISQIFWLTITFLGLWFVMSWWIIPRIAEIIDERRQKIESYLQKAENINKQALSALERYNEAIDKAKQDVAEKLAQEKLEMQREIEEQKAGMEEMLNKKIAENEYILAKERLEIMGAINDVSIQSAAAILQKLNLSDDNLKEDLREIVKTGEGHV